jgi:carbamate kinase
MRRTAEAHGWSIGRDGAGWRRLVASPQPQSILEIATIRRLIEAGVTVICAGGGGIPVIATAAGALQGVEAVLDKDATSGLLAALTDAALFVMLTDVDAVYLDFGTPAARAVVSGGPSALEAHHGAYQSGSMGPKVAAACRFVEATGRPAAIGALADFAGIVTGESGTTIALPERELVFRGASR